MFQLCIDIPHVGGADVATVKNDETIRQAFVS